jgi:hypothetical protein
MAAFFLYIPILPMLVIAAILTGMAVMFVLGLHLGINADLKSSGQSAPLPAKASEQLAGQVE